MLPSDYMEQLRELQAKQPDKKLMPRTIVTTSNSMRKIKRERDDDDSKFFLFSKFSSFLTKMKKKKNFFLKVERNVVVTVPNPSV